MRELLREIFASMQSNRTRIALTGFSVGWGMFILVVLLGSAGGFQRGLNKTFYLDLPQIVTVSAGKTSESFQGLDKGHQIKLHLSDANELVNSNIPHVGNVFPVARMTANVWNGVNVMRSSIVGCKSGHVSTEYKQVVSGRDLNNRDWTERRKVCVINDRLARIMFPDSVYLGRDLIADSTCYTVVGVCRSRIESDVSISVYIPLSVFLTKYRPDKRIDAISIVATDLKTETENETFNSSIHDIIASRNHCSPTDYKGVKIDNGYELTLSTMNIVGGIGVFVWIIGIATLIAGIVGVSNIMLITIRERTRELGVRKAMGASNRHIISLVLLESVIITMIFGYMGMMAGVGITQLLDMALGDSVPMFQNPVIQFWPSIGCTFIMVLAGLFAGYVPAKRAVSIKLVDALNG